MTKPLIEYFPCPGSCSSIQQVFTHLIFMSAMWDRHFYYYASFAEQETEAGFANWPRVTCQGNGGAAIRFWAAWLQSHSLIHTGGWGGESRKTRIEGGTFWAKEGYHLTEAAGIDRARVTSQGHIERHLDLIRKAVGGTVNELTKKIICSQQPGATDLTEEHGRCCRAITGSSLGFLIISASVLLLSSGLFDFPLALSPLALRDQSLQNLSHQAVWAHCPTSLPSNSYRLHACGGCCVRQQTVKPGGVIPPQGSR